MKKVSGKTHTQKQLDEMMRMGDNMAMDMDSGELHIISSWEDEDD